MRPHAFLMMAGVALAGCATHEPDYSGASVEPVYAVTSGNLAGAPLDRPTRLRLHADSPQTYSRLYRGEPLRISDVIALTRAGASDDVIISELSATHSVFHPDSSDVLDLHNSGVSQPVIDYMLNTSRPAPALPEQTTPSQTVVVSQPPPPSPPETVVASPNPDYVWVPGEWMWNDRWVWLPGRWVARPFPEAEWIKGSWERTPEGWLQNPGHWR